MSGRKPYGPAGGHYRNLREQLAGQQIGGRWDNAVNPAALQQTQRLPGYELARVSVPQEDACPWTVVLGNPPWGRGLYQETVFEEPTDSARAYARVWFSNGGVSATYIDVDWGQGCAFTVFGSEVRVNFIQPNWNKDALADWQIRQSLEAFIVRGTSPTESPITRTVWYAELSQSEIDLKPIPPFAKRFWVQIEAAIVATATLTFWRNAGTDRVAGYLYNAVNQRNYPELFDTVKPVPQDATQLGIQNTGTQDNSFQVIYELAL